LLHNTGIGGLYFFLNQLTARAWRVDDGSSSVIGSNPWQAELMSYDGEGRVADKWVWTGDKTEWDTHTAYTYNRAGEVIKQKTQVGSETLYHHYSYNPRGLLSKVYISTGGTQPATPEVSYTYTATGAVETIDYKGDKDIDYGYTLRDWVASINDINNPINNFAAFYEYYDNGNVKTAQYHNSQVQSGGGPATPQWAFGYDGLGRLTGADYKLSGSNPNAFDVPNISYDSAGNITLLQRRDQAGVLVDDLDYKYENGNNQLSSLDELAGATTAGWDAETGSFAYDNNGNLISMTGNPQITSISYDHRNLPTTIQLDATNIQTAHYDGNGQRILKEETTSSGTSWSFYLMDGQQTLGLIENGQLSYLNIFGNGIDGWVLANSGSISATGNKRFYVKDRLGSVRAVVDENGTTKENRDYGPWGIPLAERQYVQGTSTIEKFTGKELDNLTGLFHFGARSYHPALGRWHSVDPKADDFASFSPYNYTLNNPIRLIDPDGKMADCPEEPCRLIDRIVNFFTTGDRTFDSIAYTEQLAKGTKEDVVREVKDDVNPDYS